MPTLRAGSAAIDTGTGTSTTLSFTVPSGTAVGDRICIWCFCTANGRTFSDTLSAYTVLAATNSGGASASAALLYKTAVSGDLGGSVTVTVSGAALAFAGAIWAVEASAGFDPTPAAGQINTSSTTVTVPGVTTTLNGDLMMWAAGARAGAAGGTPATITAPAGFSGVTTQANSSSSSVANAGVVLASATQASAGATGSQNGSLTSSQANGGMLITFGDTGGGPASPGALLGMLLC